MIVLTIWLAVSRSDVHKGHVTILGLFISIALTIVLTDIVKNAVGRPRPDLIARCKPTKDAPKDTLVTIGVCTETNYHTLHDGWRSFPSGHSSFAFGGLGYLALYVVATVPTIYHAYDLVFCSFLAGQMHVFRPRTDLARVLLALSPLVGAALIAISRCEDYRHDVYDVTVGSIIGMSLAYFSYRRYYPSLKSPLCDTPFPSRAETASKNGTGRVRDEEESMQRSDSFSASVLEGGGERVPLRSASRDRGKLVRSNSNAVA